MSLTKSITVRPKKYSVSGWRSDGKNPGLKNLHPVGGSYVHDGSHFKEQCPRCFISLGLIIRKKTGL